MRGGLVLLLIESVGKRLLGRNWQTRRRRRHLTAAAANGRQNRVERLAQSGGRDKSVVATTLLIELCLVLLVLLAVD